ncbi:MAG: hypothetical protein WBV06_14295 [Acidimicrobiia bacterium]
MKGATVPEIQATSWSKSAQVNISSEELWDLMWRPETQPRWLGEGPAIRLERDTRCALTDEAGIWRSGYVEKIRSPSGVTLHMEPPPAWGDAGPTTVRIRIAAMAERKSRVEIEEADVPAARVSEVERYWSRRLGLIRAMATAVNRRRDQVKQAVVVIHGIGEQQPGATLASLAASGVLPHGEEGESIWVKPDRASHSFELRKMTYKASFQNRLPSTDVFEFYWAHTIRDTTLGQLGAWMRRLLLRRRVPRPLRPLWLMSWVLIIAAAAMGVAVWIGAIDLSRWLVGGTALVVIVGAVWKLIGRGLALQVLGDAARYLLPLPGNIAHRQAIREAGVELLERLHDSGEYDRVVILGHSLGSVIAYDIVTHAWIRMNTRHQRPRTAKFAELRDVERSVAVSGTEAARKLQHAAWRRQRANTQPWLVTDLVTVGSPLTYADLLMAAGPEALAEAKRDRILPTCPPVTEREASTGHLRMSYERPFRDALGGTKLTFTQFHHAAPFAVTRWTNLYFQTKWFGIAGDIVGGPVAGCFGDWVRDVALTSPAHRFTHTWYWRPAGDSAHLAALRDALALDGRPDLVELLREVPAYSLIGK